MKQFATLRATQAAAKYGEHAPLATACCNASDVRDDEHRGARDDGARRLRTRGHPVRQAPRSALALPAAFILSAAAMGLAFDCRSG